MRAASLPSGGSLLLLGGIALLLVFAKVLLIPLAFAITLSFLLAPVVAKLEKHGVKRALAVALTSGMATACLIFGAYGLSRQVLSVAQTLPSYRANIERRIASLHSSSESSIESAVEMLEDMNGGFAVSPARGDAVAVRVVGQKSDELFATLNLAGVILEPIGEIGIVIIFAVYLLMNREDLRHRLLLLAGMGNINLMTRALDEATRRISHYLVAQFQVNACYGVLFGGGLFLLHVPQAALWGVIAGTLRVVPYLGTLIGVATPLLLSVALSSSWQLPLMVLLWFLVLEGTTAYLIEPMVFSSRTGISSLALLGSAIFWSMLWGLPGLVLSTPLTVCVVVFGRYVPQLSFLNTMLGTTAKLSPAAHMYERLLAMDQAAATNIAESYLQGKPLVQLYDSVLVPVLSLAEEDRHRGALTEIQSKFLLLSLGELVARLTPFARRTETVQAPALNGGLMRRKTALREFAIVCLASEDPADELTSVMIAQLLEGEGHQTLQLCATSLSDEILVGLSSETETVIVLSALPPFAFAQARTVCQRLKVSMPKNRIAVGLWNSDEDGDELLERFGSAKPDYVMNRLGQAMSQIGAWQRGE